MKKLLTLIAIGSAALLSACTTDVVVRDTYPTSVYREQVYVEPADGPNVFVYRHHDHYRYHARRIGP